MIQKILKQPAVPLKYLSKRNVKMPLINCEISRILTWSLTKFNRCWNFCALTDAKLYVLVVTLSTQDNAKLLEQLKPGFKRINIGININQKCRQYLVDPSFQVVNRLFALSFEDNAVRIRQDIFLHLQKQMTML